MEHVSYSDQSKSTFSLADEDHTLANAVRFTLNQDPRVTFCGYSIPHPSENRVNIRVQTTDTGMEKGKQGQDGTAVFSVGEESLSDFTNGWDPAREVLKDGCQDLMLMCQHVRSTLDKAVSDFKMNNTQKDMDI